MSGRWYGCGRRREVVKRWMSRTDDGGTMPCNAGKAGSEIIDTYSCQKSVITVLERAARPPQILQIPSQELTQLVARTSLPILVPLNFPIFPSFATCQKAGKPNVMQPNAPFVTHALSSPWLVASISASEPDCPRLMTLLFPDSRSRGGRGAGEVSEHGWGRRFSLLAG